MDRFSPSNLPPGSQKWRREVEDSIIDLRSRITELDSRTRQQAVGLQGALDYLSGTLRNTSQVSVSAKTSRNSGFSLAVGGAVVDSLEFSAPEWATNALITVTGTGYLVSNQEFPSAHIWIESDEVSSEPIDMWGGIGASARPFSGVSSLSTSLGVPEDRNVRIELLIGAANNQWFTGDTNRIATLNATVLFTR